VSKLFPAYRVLAIVVGILLTILVFVGLPLKYLTTEGTSVQLFGEHVTTVVGIAHGWLYMAYLVVAFLLSRRARWSLPFTLLTLAAGLLPIVIFFVEHAVNRKVRAEHPELVPSLAP
jgi:integral membrane protein